MSNLAKTASNLPTIAQPSALAMAMTSGLGGGEGRMFPEVSIKGARWRLRPVGDGEEKVLPSFNIQFALVSANPAKSKTFYLSKYDPEGEPKAPDCYSDDGVRPASDVGSPQAVSCANCPHNVWGSDINPVSGKKNKKCKDSKRIAVMMLGDPNADIYAWRLSPMNMLAFSDAIKDAVCQGVDIERVAFDATFDTKSDYPKVIFTVHRPLTGDELDSVSTLRQSEGAKAAIGTGGVVVQAAVREEPKVTAHAIPVEAVEPQNVTAMPKKSQKAAATVDLDSLLDG